VFPPGQQSQVRTMLSESIVGVCSQMLLKKRGGGRVGAYEVLVGTPAVRNLIREGKVHQLPSVLQVAAKAGMQTLEHAVLQLVRNRQVSLEGARARLPTSDALAAMAAQSQSQMGMG
jgi:twitching motility protein PilT